MKTGAHIDIGIVPGDNDWQRLQRMNNYPATGGYGKATDPWSLLWTWVSLMKLSGETHFSNKTRLIHQSHWICLKISFRILNIRNNPRDRFNPGIKKGMWKVATCTGYPVRPIVMGGQMRIIYTVGSDLRIRMWGGESALSNGKYDC